jgi:hypothetical protein
VQLAGAKVSVVSADCEGEKDSSKSLTLHPNKTSLPDRLQTGIEVLSGLSMDDVQVHYNSSKPNQLNALAYTQGTDIYVASGQEKHLPHEAWHVVQQKQGRVKPILQMKNGTQINDDKGLESEADVMGAAALNQKAPSSIFLRATSETQPIPQRGKHLGTRLIQRRTYSELDGFNKARVDALAERDYATHAEKFEERLGWKLSEAPPAVEAVDAMLDAVKKIVDAWAEHTGQAKLKVYKQEFQFDEGDKYFGAFKMTGEAIKKVFDSRNYFGKAQPARKKLKVVYNAVRSNNLAKWLKVAVDDMDKAVAANPGVVPAPTTVIRSAKPVRQNGGLDFSEGVVEENVQSGFAARAGLAGPGGVLNDPTKADEIRAASHRERVDLTTHDGSPIPHAHIAAPDMWSGLALGTPEEAFKINQASKDRLYNQNTDVPPIEQHTVRVGDISNLTSHEILLIQERGGAPPLDALSKREKQRFKARADDKIAWEQGREAIMVMLNSQVEKAADAIGARLEAGVSGSTNMMFVAAKNLGLDNPLMLQKLRLAMLGWMLPNHDHSFYEIMKAAEIQGVTFDSDPLRKGYQYEAPGNYTPMLVNTFRDLLDQRVFPSHFLRPAYKNELAARLQGSHRREPAKRSVENMGLPTAIASQLSDRALIELRALRNRIEHTTFKDPTVGTPADQRAARATNRSLARHIREEASFRYLVHEHPTHAEVWFGQLLAHAGKPLADDQDMLRGIDQVNRLPKLPVNDATRQAADVTRRAALVTAGIPNNIVAGIPEHIINDLIQISAIIPSLPLNRAEPLQSPANQLEHKKLMSMPQTERLINVFGLSWARQNLNRLLAPVYGEPIAQSVLEPILELPERSPEGRRLRQAGIPDAIVSKVFLTSASTNLIAGINSLIGKIVTIAASPPPTQIAALQALSGTYARLKAVIDRLAGVNRFDMMVGGIASHNGIDLSSDVHLQTLARAASVLNTALSIVIPPAETAGFQLSALNAAGSQLDQNLLKEGILSQADTPFADLTPVEIASIRAYTGIGGMGAWQEVLWNPVTTDRRASDKLVKLAPKIEAAVSGLRKLPVALGPVYSAARQDLAREPARAMQQFRPGQIIDQGNFLSSARSVDASFIPKDGYGVAYVINAIKTGRNINVLSTNYGEEEVLFPPGAKLLVTKVEDRSGIPGGHGKVWVYMLEV